MTLGKWLRRYTVVLVAAIGGAAGMAYAAGAWKDTPAPAPVIAVTPSPVILSVAPAPHLSIKVAEPPRDNVQDTVQIALLLDTSSSMDGLINQARAQLWTMVDQMGRMSRVVDGKTRTVKIELALFEYGNDTLSEKTGYIRQVLPFTTDLDTVSQKLHGLFTNGGSEYVGQAIQNAATTLQWSKDPNALRFVFVAGNEEFDQGPVSAAQAMKAAAKQDINVQLIYCGDKDVTWEAAAKIAKTDLMTIDQNHVAQHIASPQDADILRLGTELNSTYLAFGADGAAAVARQEEADTSSAKMSAKVALDRAQLKGKASYDNSGWDVIDALNGNAKFLEETADDKLPASLRGKTLAEKKEIVAAKAKERAALQAQLAKLEVERTKFIEAERAKLNTKEAQSLESELMKTTRKIATGKGYQLGK
jgi:hypothetical protein